MSSSTISNWLNAARLRTLPLSVSGIILGSAMAFKINSFYWDVFVLAIITTLLLQILSNLANDYGDFVSGVDNKNRVGPQRATQAGLVSPGAMKTAVIITALLSLLSGILLLAVAFKGTWSLNLALFLLVGFGAIAAAIKYTVGSKPFGYIGLGDLMVFLFFGPVSVLGIYYLHVKLLPIGAILPAFSIGFLSTGVLNINNLRDFQNDKNSGKTTLVVRMGEQNAKIYQTVLIALGYTSLAIYLFMDKEFLTLAFTAIPLFLLLKHLRNVFTKSGKDLDPELKQLALATFFLALIASFGLIL